MEDLWLAKKTTKISWKSIRADKLRCTWAVSGQKQVQYALDQWQGSWGAFFSWFQNVPVFGPKRTRYTCFWQLPIFRPVVLRDVGWRNYVIPASRFCGMAVVPKADHPTPTLTLTLTWTLWRDQCLDAMACEGSRSIRPARVLCLEGL